MIPRSAIETGNHSVVLDVKLFLRSGGVFAFNDVIRLRPDAVDISFLDQVRLEGIVFPPDDLRAPLALFDRE